MIEIERIEIVTPIHGRTGTVMAQRIETINGRTSYIDPVDLKLGFDGSELPQEVQDALAAIDAQQQATIATLTTERTSLQSQLAAMTTARDTAIATIETLQARIAELEAMPTQAICTNFQIRAWLITKYGLGIIDQVTAMISAIPDATQRLLAIQQWEYANNVLRDNPFVNQIAKALGMTSEEMDAAYLEASKIV